MTTPGSAVFILIALLTSCQSQITTITFFHSDCLSPLVKTVSHRFEMLHPKIVVLSEASGSLDTIRKLTVQGQIPDLLAVSDLRLIKLFLDRNQLGKAFVFLGNEIVLAARDQQLLKEVNQSARSRKDWHEVIMDKQYSYGIANPDRDSAGYYSHLTWKLTEILYSRPGLYRRLLNGLDSHWIYPESSKLVSLLQNQLLDLAFLYRSTALQNGLSYLDLPPQISLGEMAYQNNYSQVFIRILGDNTNSVVELGGVPIRYGVALMSKRNPLAELFLDYLLSYKVRALYRELGYRNIGLRQMFLDNPNSYSER